MATGALRRICDLTGLDPLYPTDSSFYEQMVVAPLPRVTDLTEFQARLYDEHRVEVPCIEWNGRHLIRVSVQGYNTERDIDVLIKALEKTLYAS
jgi:isopenicillin-N epimerase